MLRACDYSVFRVHYTYDKQVRTPTPGSAGLDSDFSHYEKDQKASKISVAPNAGMALEAFKLSMGQKPNGNYTSIDKIELVDQVHTMVLT